MMRWLRIGAALLSLPSPLLAAADPVFSDAGPDAAAYGAAQGYPIGGRSAPAQAEMVGTYSHYDRIWPFHRVARAETPAPLRRAAARWLPWATSRAIPPARNDGRVIISGRWYHSNAQLADPEERSV